MLKCMGLQGVRHNLATEQQQNPKGERETLLSNKGFLSLKLVMLKNQVML